MIEKNRTSQFNIYLFYFLLLGLFLINCKKTVEEPIITPYSGEATALKDGDVWSGELYAIFLKPKEELLSVSIEVFNEVGFLRQSLGFYKFPPQTGLYPLRNTSTMKEDSLVGAVYSTLLFDGDVLGGIWYLLETEDNQLEIEEVNLETGDVRGTFQVTMVLDSTIRNLYLEELESPLPYEDTIRFTNGRFFTKIV